MDKQIIEMIDSAQTVAVLATVIASKAVNNDHAKETAERYMDDALKEIWRCRQALCEIIKMQEHEVHNNYRYPRYTDGL